MESTPSSRNFKAEVSETTAKQTLDSDCIFSMADNLLNICPSTAPFIVNAALNVALSIVTTIANILVFDAIRKSTSLHLPSKLLLCGLVLTDLAVGLIYEPLNTAFLISKDPLWSYTQCILGISATLFWKLHELRFIVDYDSNEFGPLHRFSFSSQVQRNRDGQTSCRVSCGRLVCLSIRVINTSMEPDGLQLLRSRWWFVFVPRHFLGLHQDLLRLTSSTWPSGATASTSGSSATGRKYTERGEVQKICLQHAVDLLCFYTVLLALYLHSFCCTISWTIRCVYVMCDTFRHYSCEFQLVFKSLPVLLSSPRNPCRRSTNTSQNVLP